MWHSYHHRLLLSHSEADVALLPPLSAVVTQWSRCGILTTTTARCSHIVKQVWHSNHHRCLLFSHSETGVAFTTTTACCSHTVKQVWHLPLPPPAVLTQWSRCGILTTTTARCSHIVKQVWHSYHHHRLLFPHSEVGVALLPPLPAVLTQWSRCGTLTTTACCSHTVKQVWHSYHHCLLFSHGEAGVALLTLLLVHWDEYKGHLLLHREASVAQATNTVCAGGWKTFGLDIIHGQQ